jgi:hypothetical protein
MAEVSALTIFDNIAYCDPEGFAKSLKEAVDSPVEERTGGRDLDLATEVAQHLEDLKIAVSWVRRHAMLDENLDVGNGAEVARRSGLRRSRAHAMMNRAIHERVRNETLDNVLNT